MSAADIAKLRTDYRQRSLSEHDVDADPIVQFTNWLNEAILAGANEPTAMTLATASPDGAPSARLVLLKRVDQSGLAFFTNYASRKASDLEKNPRAAVVFWWPELERQVRIEGTITHTSETESDEYFASRPLESRIGAVASSQSQPIDSREALEAAFAKVRAKHPDGNVPRPPNWGGYQLTPNRFEFWQGRPSRLHDRIEYQLDYSNHEWKRQRLSP